jgi:hypothetical protein
MDHFLATHRVLTRVRWSILYLAPPQVHHQASYLIQTHSHVGTLAAILTHPFDVLKTQYQLSIKQGLIQNVEDLSAKMASGNERDVCKIISECCCPCTCRVETPTTSQVERPKLAIVDGLSHILKTRGVPGLFRGLTMRLATIIPGSGIMITTYEFAKTLHLQ